MNCVLRCCYVDVSCFTERLLCVVTFFMMTFPAITQNQLRPFPPLFNAALNRPVHTDPSDSTCGVPQRNAYCESTTFANSVLECSQKFCLQTCPTRQKLPTAKELSRGVTPGFGHCVSFDRVNTHPGSTVGDFSTHFSAGGPSCFLTPSHNISVGDRGAFTIAMWIWDDTLDEG